MVKIKKFTVIKTIKPDPTKPTILKDGTIKNPIPYNAVNIEFDDEILIQVEKPLTITKIKTAYNKAKPSKTIDGISEGQDIVM